MTTSVSLTTFVGKRSCGCRWRGRSGWLAVVPEVADGPLAVLGHRRGDVAVVEQRGVGAEALLAHELLVVEPPTRPRLAGRRCWVCRFGGMLPIAW